MASFKHATPAEVLYTETNRTWLVVEKKANNCFQCNVKEHYVEQATATNATIIFDYTGSFSDYSEVTLASASIQPLYTVVNQFVVETGCPSQWYLRLAGGWRADWSYFRYDANTKKVDALWSRTGITLNEFKNLGNFSVIGTFYSVNNYMTITVPTNFTFVQKNYNTAL